jgi:hypothetical protein
VKQWMKDRDLLIEDTLAFVQRVASTRPARTDSPRQVEPPKTVAMVEVGMPKDKIFEREEIRQRLADFEATQHKFQHEREEYFKKTMAKVRSKSSDV